MGKKGRGELNSDRDAQEDDLSGHILLYSVVLLRLHFVLFVTVLFFKPSTSPYTANLYSYLEVDYEGWV